MGVEEGQRDLAGVVMGEDAIGDAPVAAAAASGGGRCGRERDDGALGRERDARLAAPVDDADRQVEEKVDHPRRLAALGAGRAGGASATASFGPMPGEAR